MPRLCSAFQSLAIAVLLAAPALSTHAQITVISSGGEARANGKSSDFDAPAYGTRVQNGTGVSSTTLSITPFQVAAMYTQSALGSDFTDGGTDIFFTAEDGTTYSVLDPSPSLSGDPSTSKYDWGMVLIDISGEGILYSQSGGSKYGSDFSGSLTGVLYSGDIYELFSGVSMSPTADPTLSYNPVVNFTAAGVPAVTPEPSSLVLLCTGLAGTAANFRRRFMA